MTGTLCKIENPSDESIFGQVPRATAQDIQNSLRISRWAQVVIPLNSDMATRNAVGLLHRRIAGDSREFLAFPIEDLPTKIEFWP